MNGVSGLTWLFVLSKALSGGLTPSCLCPHVAVPMLPCLFSGHGVSLPLPRKSAGLPPLRFAFSPVHDATVSGAITGPKQDGVI